MSVHETACVNARSTRYLCEEVLVARLAGTTIYVVCDNARYYKIQELPAWLQGKSLA